MYSPKIRPELIRRLYLLKQKEKRKNLTVMVNDAVEKYLRELEDNGNDSSKEESK